MPAADYKLIIFKTLKAQMGKCKSLEELTDKIVNRMEQYDEFRSDFADLPLVGSPQNQAAQSAGPSMILMQSPAKGLYDETAKQPPQTFDVGARIGSVVEKLPAIDPYRKMEASDRKDLLRSYIEKSTPGKLPLSIKGQSVEMTRRLENAPGDMEFVRLIYSVPGTETASFTADGMVQPGNQGASVQVGTDEVNLDADRWIADIMKQATSMYNSEPKRVQTMAPPRYASLGEAMQGSPNAETDRQANPSDMARWGADMARTAADRYK